MMRANFKDDNNEMAVELGKPNIVGIIRSDGVTLYVKLSDGQLKDLAEFIIKNVD